MLQLKGGKDMGAFEASVAGCVDDMRTERSSAMPMRAATVRDRRWHRAEILCVRAVTFIKSGLSA
ncbi:MAG: hypothetical protein R3D66_01240 [Alphaproteobacteria bacterium]